MSCSHRFVFSANDTLGNTRIVCVVVRHGSILDDVERGVRMCSENLLVGRFRQLTVEKRKKPGQYEMGRGGISALHSSGAEFDQRRTEQLHAICQDHHSLNPKPYINPNQD